MEKELFGDSNLRKQSFSQTSFTSTPKIRRRHTGNRSVRRTAKALVDSFYPITEVSYNNMKMRLMNSFGRCSRQTILAYLGRPKTHQKETVDHTVTYPTSGAITNKIHTFIHKLPAKKGYLETFGLAALNVDRKTGELGFKLFHQRQTELNEADSPLRNPPSESFALKELYGRVVNDVNDEVAPKNFFLSLDSVQDHNVADEPLDAYVSRVRETEIERELLSERKNQRHEHKRIQTCSSLSDEEKRILGLDSAEKGKK